MTPFGKLNQCYRHALRDTHVTHTIMSSYSSKWLKVTEPHPTVLLVELARCAGCIPYFIPFTLYPSPPVNAFNVEYVLI